MKLPLVGTTLDKTGSATHSGFVDLFDGFQGIRGWAVNLADPSKPVRLELWVGSQAVAETLAEGERADISAKLGRPALAGFHFDADAMLTIADFLDDPRAVLSVRVAATGQHLPCAAQAPTAAEIVALQRAHSVPEPAGEKTDLETLLDELQTRAASMVDQPLRPIPENLQGYIETLAVDTSGQVWFMGWMRRGHVQEFSAVIVERRKYAAAVAVTSYVRDDLPAQACGVVGLIVSDWRPSSASRELLMYFGAGGRFHLRSHDPLRMITSGELVVEYEAIRDRHLGDGRVTALQRMLTAMENWMPSRSAAQQHGTETSIDRVLLIPGLGCLVEGWIMSPMKRVEGLRLRVGASVMVAQPESLYWKARPDLLAAYAGSERMIRRAGFVGLFAGQAEPEDFIDPVLKAVFEGGSSANFPVPARVFRRLGHSAAVEDALAFFPALQDEAFFPAFAQAAIRAERGVMNPPVPISIVQSRRAMIFVLPEERCDLFRLFDNVAQRCRTREKSGGPAIEAVAFVASARANRSDALWLFREFEATCGKTWNIACSLLLVDDAAEAFDLLPEILRVLGTNRFLFAASGLFLTEAGWKRAQQALSASATDLVFFGLAADIGVKQAAADGATSGCFAWSAGHFTRWARTAPAFMGGLYNDNALTRAGVVQTVLADGVRAARVSTPSRIAEAVNAIVYARAIEGPGASRVAAA